MGAIQRQPIVPSLSNQTGYTLKQARRWNQIGSASVCVCECVQESCLYVFPADFTTCSRQCQPDSFISQQDSVQTHTHTQADPWTQTQPHIHTSSLPTHFWQNWLNASFFFAVQCNQPTMSDQAEPSLEHNLVSYVICLSSENDMIWIPL